MTECPDVETLQQLGARSDLQEHVSACASCRIVLELLEERNVAIEKRDRRAQCARFEMLLAAREDGSLGTTASELLDEHLRGCAACTRVANTAPPSDRGAPQLRLEAIPTSHYALGREVARGGMGRILAAEDLRIGRPVAVKELLESSPALAARFEREARVTAGLQHPGIVPIYEIGKWPDGTPFYTMRMVEGRTLRDSLRDKASLDERLAMLPSVISAAEAIAFAHARRIIHRDLTPNNVLVGAYGETVVIDWGLAKDLSVREDDVHDGPYRDATGSPELTMHGAVIGTAAYMPPEQARAESVDERADVYALGAILYHLLAGAPPYASAASDDVIRKVQTHAPRPIAELAPNAPRDLLSIVNKAMAREPSLRYRTAQGIVDELRRFQMGRIVEAHHYSTAERTRRWLRRHRVFVVAATATLLALSVAGTVGIVGVMRERDQAETGRRDAEAQRAIARTQSTLLLEESGRQELLAGNPVRAALWLSAAYSAGNARPSLRLLLGTAMRAAESHKYTFECPPDVTWIDRIDLSPDEKQLAVPCHEEIRLWNTADGTLTRALRAPNGTFNSVRFSHDGRTVVAWGRDSGVWLWDCDSGELRATLRGHLDKVLGVTFSPDDKRVLSSSMDGTVRTWDAITGQLHTAILAAPPPIKGVRAGFFDDGSSIVSATPDGKLTLWNARNGTLVRRVDNGSQILSGSIEGAFSSVTPSSKEVIACSADGLVNVWNLETGTKLLSFAAHGDHVWSCTLDSERKRLVTTGSDGTAKVWALPSGRLLMQLDHAGRGQTGAVVTQDGRRIVTAGNAHIRVWDAVTGALLGTYDAGVESAMDLDRTGDHLYGTVESATPGPSKVYAFHGLGAHRMSTFDAGANGRVVALDELFARAAVERDGRIELWDVASHVQLPHAELRPPAASANRRFAATTNNGVAVIDLVTLKDVTSIALPSPPSFLSLSDDGKRLITKMPGETILWDVDAHRELLRWPPGWHVEALSIDLRVAAAWQETTKTVELWDIAGRRVLSRFTVHSDPLQIVGFDRTSRRLVVFVGAQLAGHFEIRDVGDGRLLARIDGPVWGFAANLDPQRTKMTVAFQDRTETWDLETASRIDSQTHLTLTGAHLSSDGTLLAMTDPMNARLNLMDATDGRLLVSQAIHRPDTVITADGFQMAIPVPWFAAGDDRVSTYESNFLSFVEIDRERRPADVIARIVREKVPWRLDGTRVVPGDAPRPAPATARLTGRLTRKGAPVTDGGVWISDLGRVVQVGRDGNYAFDDLPATSLRLMAGSSSLEAFATPKRHTLKPGDNHVDIELDSATSISGRVTGDRGQPGPGSRIIAYCTACAEPVAGQASVDSAGRFEISGIRDGERYALLLVDESGRSYETIPKTIDVRAGEERVTDLAIRALPAR